MSQEWTDARRWARAVLVQLERYFASVDRLNVVLDERFLSQVSPNEPIAGYGEAFGDVQTEIHFLLVAARQLVKTSAGIELLTDEERGAIRNARDVLEHHEQVEAGKNRASKRLQRSHPGLIVGTGWIGRNSPELFGIVDLRSLKSACTAIAREATDPSGD
jgi:hypothetical protein